MVDASGPVDRVGLSVAQDAETGFGAPTIKKQSHTGWWTRRVLLHGLGYRSRKTPKRGSALQPSRNKATRDGGRVGSCCTGWVIGCARRRNGVRRSNHQETKPHGMVDASGPVARVGLSVAQDAETGF